MAIPSHYISESKEKWCLLAGLLATNSNIYRTTGKLLSFLNKVLPTALKALLLYSPVFWTFPFKGHIHTYPERSIVLLLKNLPNEHPETWVLRSAFLHIFVYVYVCGWIVVLENTFESPLDFKEVKPVNPKGNQPWIWRVKSETEDWIWNFNILATL